MMETQRAGVRRTAVATATAALVLAGCVAGCVAGPGATLRPGATAGGPASGAQPTASDTGREAGPSGSPPAQPTPVRSVPRVSPSSPPVDLSAVPEAIVQAVRLDAAGRTGVDPAGVTFVRADATTWPDGALGCPEPGSVYTQALVSGYWLVVEAGGRRLDYRATQRGALKLCANPPGPG